MVVLNHISHVDPLAAAHILWDHGRIPRYLAKSGLFENKVTRSDLQVGRPDPGRAAERQRRRGVRRRGGRGPRRRVRRGLPGGDDHPRPGDVADDRQVRRGPDRARDGLPGHPDRAVGCAGGAGAVREEAGPVPAQDDHHEGRRPRRPQRPRGPGAHHRRWSPPRPTGSWPRSPRSSPSSVARRRPPSASTRAPPVSPRSATPTRSPREEGVLVSASLGKVAVYGAGSWGTAFSIVLADGGNDVTVWARREEVADAINELAREPRLPARHRAAAVRVRDPRRREGRARRRHRDPRDAVADAARQPRGVGAAHRAGRGDGLADEGRRARHPQADERGHRRGHRRRARAGRGDQRPQPGQGDRPPGAGRVGGRLRRRGRREDAAGPVPLAGVPSLHEHRRARLRAGRRLQERRRPRGRHGGRARLRRQHDRLGDHPGPGRDRPAGDGARRQPAHADGARRARRPGRHLLLAAVPQPHLRREARAGHDHRGDLRLDPPGRRGRQVLLVAACPRRAVRRRRPGRAVRRRRRRRPDDRARDDGRHPQARDRSRESD